jgi:hypothetical protein
LEPCSDAASLVPTARRKQGPAGWQTVHSEARPRLRVAAGFHVVFFAAESAVAETMRSANGVQGMRAAPWLFTMYYYLTLDTTAELNGVACSTENGSLCRW